MATLGTLAVLMIIVMAAANSAQMTWNTAAISIQDTRLRNALSEAAVLVQTRPQLLSDAATANATTTNTETAGARKTIIPAAAGSKQIMVLASTESLDSMTSEIARLPGDTAVLLQARSESGKGQRRAATYVINTQGQRPSPILILEQRL